jgi:hypothetical protein
MKSFEGLKKKSQSNWQGFIDNILKKGTENIIANYIPLENYLTMADESRLYSQ